MCLECLAFLFCRAMKHSPYLFCERIQIQIIYMYYEGVWERKTLLEARSKDTLCTKSESTAPAVISSLPRLSSLQAGPMSSPEPRVPHLHLTGLRILLPRTR